MRPEIHFIDLPVNKVFFELEGGYIEPICLQAETKMYESAEQFEKDIEGFAFVFILRYAFEFYERKDDQDFHPEKTLYVRWCAVWKDWVPQNHIVKCHMYSRELDDKSTLIESVTPDEIWEKWKNERNVQNI